MSGDSDSGQIPCPGFGGLETQSIPVAHEWRNECGPALQANFLLIHFQFIG